MDCREYGMGSFRGLVSRLVEIGQASWIEGGRGGPFLPGPRTFSLQASLSTKGGNSLVPGTCALMGMPRCGHSI